MGKVTKKIQVPISGEKAFDKVIFKAISASETALELEHTNFENHGERAKDYQKAMDSAQGWDYILNRYVESCKK